MMPAQIAVRIIDEVLATGAGNRSLLELCRAKMTPRFIVAQQLERSPRQCSTIDGGSKVV
jgi:hypothetical protein